MKSGNFKARFGYADDIGILGIGRIVAESASKAQQEADSLLDWINSNAVSFDNQKSEVIKIHGRRREELSSITVNGSVINLAEHIHWLGVHPDNRLNFKNHVTNGVARH